MRADVRICWHGSNRLCPSSHRGSRASAGHRGRSQLPAQTCAAGALPPLFGRQSAYAGSGATGGRQPTRGVALANAIRRAGIDGLLRDKTRKPGRAPLSARIVASYRPDLLGAAGPRHAPAGRAMAKAVGVSLPAVQRLWEAHRLQPHRIRTFSAPTILSSPRRSRISSASTRTRPSTRYSSRSTTRAKSRRSTARNRASSPENPGRWPMTTSATVRPLCSPRPISSTEPLRLCRRPYCLSQAAIAELLSMAK